MKGDYSTGEGRRKVYCVTCRGDIWFGEERVQRGEWISKRTGRRQLAPYIKCPNCGNGVRLEVVTLVT